MRQQATPRWRFLPHARVLIACCAFVLLLTITSGSLGTFTKIPPPPNVSLPRSSNSMHIHVATTHCGAGRDGVEDAQALLKSLVVHTHPHALTVHLFTDATTDTSWMHDLAVTMDISVLFYNV